MERDHDAPRWRRYRRFWGADPDADVDDELRFHLEMRADDLRRGGLPADEARREAERRFGDVARVRGWLRAHDRTIHRRRTRADTMDALLLDVRYALRTLRLQPGFTLAVVLVLGIGIGAATAMFGAVDAALLRPLPFRHHERLVELDAVGVPFADHAWPKNRPELDEARALRDVFDGVGAYLTGGLNLTGGDAPARARVALVTPDLLPMLGVHPALGRTFAPDEGTPATARVALLSDALWRTQFGGDSAIVGGTVRLNDVPYTVVGVMPPGFGFPRDAELWLALPVPFSMDGATREAFRQSISERVVARLAPGVTPHGAAVRLEALVRQWAGPEWAPDVEEPLVTPLRDVLVGNRRDALLVLMGATILLMLVACANVTNLLLARAATRRAELTLRASLGASRWRLARQLLVESAILALGGSLLGVALAYATLDGLAALLPPSLTGVAPARVDARVLGFAVAAAAATGLLFGLWPALGASRANPAATLKAGSAGGATRREGVHARRVFVVVEIALALMLAVGAGLMLRSFRELASEDFGMRTERAASLEVSLPRSRYATAARRAEFLERVLARLRATPGIEAAGSINGLPLTSSVIGIPVTAAGRPAPPMDDIPFTEQLEVSPDYFAAAGIPLRRGRTVPAGGDSTAPGGVVINERLAAYLWPGEDPIGRSLVRFGLDTQTVVGVVGDTRGWAVDKEPQPQMYDGIGTGPMANFALVARGALPPAVLARRMTDAVRAVDPQQAVYNVRPLGDVVDAALAPRRTNTVLITAFGAIAVALAAVGVYGVIAYGVARRTREIGIRVALGARREDVLALVAREGLVLAVVGVTLGLAGAWALRQVLASLLYGVTPADPAAFAGAAAVLLVVAVAATLLPARRALHVDPARTMRVE